MANVAQHILKRTHRIATAGVQGASNRMSSMADFATRGLIKETPATFANAYTGMAPTKLATGLFAAGAAAYAWGGSMKAEVRSKAEQSRHEFVGTAPVLTGDGVGNKSSAPTLGASGNLVFGLHNRR